MTPTRRHWSRKHGVWVYIWGGAVIRSFLFFFVHAQFLKIQVQPTNERANQPTKDFLQQTLFTAPPASTRRAGGGGRFETRAAYAVVD
jgi:hypothetical protein